MAILDYFKPIATMSVGEVRKFLEEKKPNEYNLVDVRQPGEYIKYHLPGAMLIPVAELSSRLHEIDPGKPVITY